MVYDSIQGPLTCHTKTSSEEGSLSGCKLEGRVARAVVCPIFDALAAQGTLNGRGSMRKSDLHVQGHLGKSRQERCVREGPGLPKFSSEAYYFRCMLLNVLLNLYILYLFLTLQKIG